jgi:DNA-binding NtrC family response regulator
VLKVLMVEDDRMYSQEIAAEVLTSFGEDLETDFAQDVQSAIAKIEASPPDLILLDMICPLTPEDLRAGRPSPDGGHQVVTHVTRHFPWVKIAILSGQDKERAIELLFSHRGITDYIFKDSPYDEIRVRILKQLEAIRFQKAQGESDDPELVGESPPMRTLRRLIERVAPEAVTVLIQGETGTGKELVAHSIHVRSRRRGGPFVKVNCAAFAESILESELFGHRKGAFTGAVTDRVGRFEAADGGTLFLDEIGEISETIQVKLLRFLQEREFEPVGSNRTVRVDVRLICATNRDLETMVQEGRFRQDFYHRIQVIPVQVPPLRERTGDISTLAYHHLRRIARDRTNAVTRLSKSALARMDSYTWPGNVRELANVLSRAAILAEGDEITEDDMMLPESSPIEEDRKAEADPPTQDVTEGALRDLLAGFERKVLIRALERRMYDVQQAAHDLGIDKRTLHNKLNYYRISRRRKRFE